MRICKQNPLYCIACTVENIPLIHIHTYILLVFTCAYDIYVEILVNKLSGNFSNVFKCFN